jgi:hypothetical protein
LNKFIAYGAALFLGAAPAAPVQATPLDQCFALKIDGKTFAATGQQILAILNGSIDYGSPPAATTPPSATPCTNASGQTPAGTVNLTEGTYYGKIDSEAKFRGLAGLTCDAPPVYRFYSLGSAVYMKYCGPNAGNRVKGYIYFWGVEGAQGSQCFAGSYPSIYTEIKGTRTASGADLIKVATHGDIGASDQAGYALGNAVSALTLGEAYRDANVVAENFMLYDLAASGVYDISRIIAGHCPADVPGDICRNSRDPRDGMHPLAWGGAEKAMMSNGKWGYTKGATSPLGMAFEANLLETWLNAKQLAQPTNAQCPPALSTDDTAALSAVFKAEYTR